MQFSKRLDRFGEEIFAALNNRRMELEQQGMKIYNMSVGTPDFKTPEHIYELEKVLGNYEAKMEEAILAGNLVEASTIRAEKEDAQKKIMQTKKRFQKKQAGRKPLVTEEEVAALWRKLYEGGVWG